MYMIHYLAHFINSVFIVLKYSQRYLQVMCMYNGMVIINDSFRVKFMTRQDKILRQDKFQGLKIHKICTKILFKIFGLSRSAGGLCY